MYLHQTNRVEFRRRVKEIIDIPWSELKKHEKRVNDIVNVKAPGDIEKQKNLAITMANKITNVDKAYGRYLVSDDLNAPHLGEIFLNRFKELTYDLKDIRKEKLMGILDLTEEDLKEGNF